MPDHHDVAHMTEFLHSVQPFNTLDGAGLRELGRKLEAAYYRQGQKIFSSRDLPGLAIIRKGAVRLLDGEQKFLDKRCESELLGHQIFFHGE